MIGQPEEPLIPTKTRHIHGKLNLDKVEHLLEFIFNSRLLQDVAYGTHNIKFDTVLKKKVANTVSTTKYTHAVIFYLKSCTDYKQLSTSTLFRILRAVKPSQWKSLGKSLYTFIVTNFAIPLVDILHVSIWY